MTNIIGHITEQNGSVKIIDADGQRSSGGNHQPIEADSIIVTGSDGMLVLTRPNGETLLDYTAMSAEPTAAVPTTDIAINPEGVFDTSTQESIFQEGSTIFSDADSAIENQCYYDPDANVFVIIPTDSGDIVQS
ncbi:MAG: hypothetical protein U9Q62_10735 [Campylobacterota bacterium]|nr:hypothetical protein [Campylobacterota bacterium]